jgi:hypothetical protein
MVNVQTSSCTKKKDRGCVWGKRIYIWVRGYVIIKSGIYIYVCSGEVLQHCNHENFPSLREREREREGENRVNGE